ncbi:MAG TPA: hypothetical protein PLX66_02205 [Bacilli bacterium]|nr:hypothetical protein [Bacilli bacterium]
MNEITPLQIKEICSYINDQYDMFFSKQSGEIGADIFHEGYCFYYAELLKKLFSDGDMIYNDFHFLFRKDNNCFGARGNYSIVDFDTGSDPPTFFVLDEMFLETGVPSKYYLFKKDNQVEDFFRRKKGENEKIESIINFLATKTVEKFPFLVNQGSIKK